MHISLGKSREFCPQLVGSRMIYGYARVSTIPQDLNIQVDRLLAAGCMRIYREKRSGKDLKRSQLRALLKRLRRGDYLVATASDRIARDPLDLLNVFKDLEQKGAVLRLLDEPFLDTSSEFSDIVAFLLGWAAKWQRRRILENTAHGRAWAKARGVKFGLKPKLSDAQRHEVRKRLTSGETRQELARVYLVSERTISRA